jgi:hypothetical protein
MYCSRSRFEGQNGGLHHLAIETILIDDYVALNDLYE